MRADGFLFPLDRESGKPLMNVEERPVPQDALQKTAATQPFPVGADRALDCQEWRKQTTPKGFEIGCFFTAASVQKPNILAPTYGMRVAPMAYSPGNRYFYASGASGLEWLVACRGPVLLQLVQRACPGAGAASTPASWLRSTAARTRSCGEREFKRGRPSGATTTAGGLLFQASADQPRHTMPRPERGSGSSNCRPRGPPIVYDLDGEQYVATVAGSNVWAFTLGGTLPPAPPPTFSPEERFTGPIVETTQIETASLQRDRGFIGTRYFTDDYAFEPYRARVKAGTQVTWRNNSRMVHTNTAEDGRGRPAPWRAMGRSAGRCSTSPAPTSTSARSTLGLRADHRRGVTAERDGRRTPHRW